MDIIYSMSNSNVKFIRGLNEKKFRVKNNAFYLEGIKVVNEILDKKKAIDILFIAYSKVLLCNANGGKEMIDRLEALKGIKVIEIEENPFRYMTDTISPQGVVVVLKMPDYDFDNEIKNCKSNIVILDKIQDLGNLGTIIRSCNAFDIDLIICTKETADVYSPKTLRSTMGGIINTKVLYVDNLEQLKKLKEYGYNIVTTSLNTDSKLCDLKIDEKYAFVMGNEANGVSKEIMNFSDMLVKIPMSDKIESLNVGVAASIILYEQYKNKTSRK